MRKSYAFAGAAALVMMALAPLSLAQPSESAPATPPVTTQPPAPPAEPTPPAAPVDQPATTPPPSAPNPVTPTSPPDRMVSATPSVEAAQGCRTRKNEGEACACLSDTTRIGAAAAHPGGYNVCVRPN